jgi:hypothetical protein
MAINEKKIREYLSYYGSNIEAWPEELYSLGYKARQHKLYASLFKEEEELERLLNARVDIKPSHSHLAQRIISAAHANQYTQKPQWWLYDMILSIKPAAVAAMLVIGFAIGFSALSPITQDKREMTYYADDDGAVL